jgi:hypothetical protein
MPKPDGPGLVLAQDPKRTEYVRGMAERVARGNSIYSVVQWLDDIGAPTPTGRGTWAYSTVERILRHPGARRHDAVQPRQHHQEARHRRAA